MSTESPSLSLAGVFDRLEGTTCVFCEDGHLVREPYKGNDALVCSTCGTPAVQTWGASR